MMMSYRTFFCLIIIVVVVAGLIGGSIGFGLSMIMRLELGMPGYVLLSANQYNCMTSWLNGYSYRNINELIIS